VTQERGVADDGVGIAVVGVAMLNVIEQVAHQVIDAGLAELDAATAPIVFAVRFGSHRQPAPEGVHGDLGN
jgi:hypothetical protein